MRRRKKIQNQQLLEWQLKLNSAAESAQRAYDAWRAAQLIHTQDFNSSIVLKPRERLYSSVRAAFLEPRLEPGRYRSASTTSRSAVAPGFSATTRFTQGGWQQRREFQTHIDDGTFAITNQRCIFTGPKRTTQWTFEKLVAFDWNEAGTLYFSVSHRQRTTGVHIPTSDANEITTIARAAVAKYQGRSAYDQLLAHLKREWHTSHKAWEAIRNGQQLPGTPEALP